MAALADRLRTRLGAGHALPEGAALDALLDGVVARGEARLPHTPVTRETFVDRIGEVLASLDGPVDAAMVERLHAADLYLACALAARDTRAIAVSEAELVPAARQAAARIDGASAFVDEVTQRARDRLLVGDGTPGAISGYRGTGPLSRWVRVVATRIALDLVRERKRDDPAGEAALERIPAPDDPELAVMWRDCAEEYREALMAAFATLSRRERNLMRQRYIDDLTIDQLGRLYRVHPATAFRWIRAVEQRLQAETRAAVMRKLALSESQVKSMERLVASQLHISLTRILRGGKKS